MEITPELMDQYRNTGGFDIIGSGRTKLEEVDQFEKGIQILRELGIKALVIIGGDDSKRLRSVSIQLVRLTQSLSVTSSATVTLLVNTGTSSNSWDVVQVTSPLSVLSSVSLTSVL